MCIRDSALCPDRVRFIGDPVAAVAAETEEEALEIPLLKIDEQAAREQAAALARLRGTRDEAIETLRRALGEMQVSGVRTTIPLLLRVLDNGDFRKGDFDTGFIETHKQTLFSKG